MLFRPDRARQSKLIGRKKGFSLIEAILASFMLLTAVIMSVSVFDSSLQAEASNENRVVASIVAESALAEIRQAANLDFAAAASLYESHQWTIAEYSGFEIESRVSPAELAVPCSILETQYDRAAVFPEPTGRYLTSSCLKVDLTVRWSSGSRQSVTITEYVTSFAPTNTFELEITQAGSAVSAATVAKDGLEEFGVSATADGRDILDIQYGWSVQPLTGFGSINTVSRDGKQCIYQNSYRNYDDKIKYSPGLCNLVVTATYQGRRAEAKVLIENEP